MRTIGISAEPLLRKPTYIQSRIYPKPQASIRATFVRIFSMVYSSGMRHMYLLLSMAVLGALVLYLHVQAMLHYWYWTYSWLDIVMHTLGGILIAGLTTWGYERFRAVPRFSRKKRMLFIVGTTLCVGLLWEVFEYVFHLTTTINYSLDTVVDLLMDTLGAIFLFYFFYRKEVSVQLKDIDVTTSDLTHAE